MRWTAELAYQVTPKSGPLRPMRTVVEAARTLVDDLPLSHRRRPYWMSVRRLILKAAATGAPLDIQLATDSLVCALEVEGWMTRAPVGAAARPPPPDTPLIMAPVVAEAAAPGWLRAAE